MQTLAQPVGNVLLCLLTVIIDLWTSSLIRCCSTLLKRSVINRVSTKFYKSLTEFITYTEDVTVFKKHRVRRHLYADDNQAHVDVLVQDIDQARSTLQHCISDVSSWCSYDTIVCI